MEEGKYLKADSDEFGTPEGLFEDLSDEFGPFDLDAAATFETSKCVRFITKEDDALKVPWTVGDRKRTRVFLNPPYSKKSGPIAAWVKKAHAESLDGRTVVCVLPADTTTGWWHETCLKHGEVRELKGRQQFVGGKSGARFGTAIIIFQPPRKYSFVRVS